jgi:hypothetical protein
MGALFGGSLVVVETEDDHFLGYLDVEADGALRLRSGFRGHPFLLDPDEVVSIHLAAGHPLVDAED